MSHLGPSRCRTTQRSVWRGVARAAVVRRSCCFLHVRFAVHREGVKAFIFLVVKITFRLGSARPIFAPFRSVLYCDLLSETSTLVDSISMLE